jgi:hypothetical protein
MTVLQAISLLNGTVPNGLTAVLRVMLMNAIHDAARRGDNKHALVYHAMQVEHCNRYETLRFPEAAVSINFLCSS